MTRYPAWATKPMTPEQFERLQQVLTALEPETKKMTGTSPNFVRDQIDRVERFGINMRVSPKQVDWLESLYRKHCGGTMKIMEDAPPASRREVLGDDDIDDEIPF